MDAHNRRQDYILFSAPLNQTYNLFAYWIPPALQPDAFMKLQHFPEHRPAVPQAYVETLPLSLILQVTPNAIKFHLLLLLSSAILSEFIYKGAGLEPSPLQQQLINNTGSSPQRVLTSMKSDPGETDAAAYL